MSQTVPHRCDIILPVFNGLNYVRDCVESVLEHTPHGLYHLWLMDDASDEVTAAYLASVAQEFPHITHVRHPQNLGFLQNCNAGMQQSYAPFVLLLNSDVVVSPRWLEKMLACADSDPTIASVNPFTNYGSNIALPMLQGISFLDMNWYLEHHAPKTYPDIVTGVGFCLLLRREALEAVGLFDEVYGMGYCEESDLCMRLTTNGWRTVVADDTYVYHKGRATFVNRDERYLANRKIFDERWKTEYTRQFAAFRAANPFQSVRDLFPKIEYQWSPIKFMRGAYRTMRQRYQQRDFAGVAKTAIRGGLMLPFAKKPITTPSHIEEYSQPGRLRVTYVLPTMGIAGGVLSVVQLVNELTLHGIEARIAAVYEHEDVYDWKMYSRPAVYKNYDQLVEKLPETDILVATHWMTVDVVDRLMQKGQAKQAAYFLQDYEAWFYPESDTVTRQKVRDTYQRIQHKIVKSDWLAGMVKADGYDTHKIRLGMDLGVFYPRAKAEGRPPTVMAMARPSTPRRGFEYVVDALKQVHAARPDVHIVLFGDEINAELLPFPATITGAIANQKQLAEHYAQADVFLDGSTFQGFGRPALEAMACGTPCVLTNVGGVNEYAIHDENCLLVPPKQPNAFANAILRLLEDDALHHRIRERGLRTAQDYCMKREGRETLRYFQSMMQEAEAPQALRRTGT